MQHRFLLIVPATLAIASALILACGGDEGNQGTPDPGSTTSSSSSSSSSSGGTSGSTSGNTPTPDGGEPANAKAVRFVAMGDTGEKNEKQQKVGNTVSAICKSRGCDFVTLLGDNIYESGASSVDDPAWQDAFEVPYSAIDLDFWVVLGNHDYGANGAGTDFPKAQNEVDYTKKSKKWKMPSQFWHHLPPTGSSKVEIFGLDTNMMMFGQAAAQKTDMTKWIADSKADWKIAIGHHPYKSNGPHGNAGSYEGLPLVPVTNGKGVKDFLEDNVCGKVDLYLCGHDHSRQWLNVSCKGTELAVSGAGSKVTEFKGNNPNLFQSLEVGFLYIVIEGKTLTAEFIDEDGKTEFTHKIVKP